MKGEPFSPHRYARPSPASTVLLVQFLPTQFPFAKLAHPTGLIREALCDQPTLLGVQLICNYGPPPQACTVGDWWTACSAKHSHAPLETLKTT